MIEVCGFNEYNQFGENSRKENQIGDPIILPLSKSQFNLSSLLSYSCQGFHSVLITRENKLLGIGDNSDGRISVSLPKEKFKEFTTFSIADSRGRSLVPVSAVCSFWCTLYMASLSDENEEHLFISYSKLESTQPIKVDTGYRYPVSLFGGCYHTAAIDNEGEVIFIHFESHESLSHTRVESSSLPENEKASSVACCNDLVAVLSLSGRVFISQASKDNKLTFSTVLELSGVKVSCLSGTYIHFIAVSREGRVFSHGSNSYGELGLGGTESVSKFTEILSLKGSRITAAYAGSCHSLFMTDEGKILACGYNGYDQLLLGDQKDNNVCIPCDTKVVRDATFCIAAHLSSSIFIGSNPPPNTPNRASNYQKLRALSEKQSNSEASQLKAKIAAMRDSIDSLNRETANLEASINILQSETESAIQTGEEACLEMASLCKLNTKKQCEVHHCAHSQSFQPPIDISKLTKDSLLGFSIHGIVGLTSQSVSFSIREISKESYSSKSDFLSSAVSLLSRAASLKHPNIARTFGVKPPDDKHNLSVVSEYYPFSVEKYVSSLTKREKVTIIMEVASAMREIHKIGIVHGHLKPSNVLLDVDHHAKVSDLVTSLMTINKTSDVAFNSEDEERLEILRFTAPELLPKRLVITEKVDVFSFGVLAFFIITSGKYARFSMEDVMSVHEVEFPSNVNKLARDLINGCMSSNPSNRPSFSEIVDYIVNNNFELIDGVGSEIDEINEFLSPLNKWNESKHE